MKFTILLMLIPAVASSTPKKDGGVVPKCDRSCVVDYCEARCSGPHRDRLQGLSDCKRACEAYVLNEGKCFPCKEPK